MLRVATPPLTRDLPSFPHPPHLGPVDSRPISRTNTSPRFDLGDVRYPRGLTLWIRSFAITQVLGHDRAHGFAFS
jgi:hypothetical protein